MRDPEENKENTKKEDDNDTSAEAGKRNESANTNWDEHMQIDEEGNEVSPGDQ